MVAIAPSSMITRCNSLFGGKVWDKVMFNHSRIIGLLEPGDALMVDKGFHIEEECLSSGVELIRPPFCNAHESQFSAEDTALSAKIASSRVHVERLIERLKN